VDHLYDPAGAPFSIRISGLSSVARDWFLHIPHVGIPDVQGVQPIEKFKLPIIGNLVEGMVNK